MQFCSEGKKKHTHRRTMDEERGGGGEGGIEFDVQNKEEQVAANRMICELCCDCSNKRTYTHTRSHQASSIDCAYIHV